jgi:NAD(P)-dependent dehydrogenase (short-subunit alcohol dehydrogenase family)
MSHPGVGTACVIALAAAGASVGIVDVDIDALNLALEMASSYRGQLLPIVADVTDPGDCEAAVRKALDRFGALTVLVNNVGVTGEPATVTEMSMAGWQLVMETNLTSMALMSKCAIPEIVSAGGGSVINISSIGAIRGSANAAYAASKGGMISLSTSMALSYGRDAVRVNVILPGHLATPMGRSNDARAKLRRSANLLGTDGTAWDVANAVVFLASDAARWITGVSLAVDGGASMSTALAIFGHMETETGRIPV